MTRLPLLALLPLLLGAAPPLAEPAHVYVVIRGGTVYTGAETSPASGDVEIAGDRIVYVGPTRGTRATRTAVRPRPPPGRARPRHG